MLRPNFPSSQAVTIFVIVGRRARAAKMIVWNEWKKELISLYIKFSYYSTTHRTLYEIDANGMNLDLIQIKQWECLRTKTCTGRDNYESTIL